MAAEGYRQFERWLARNRQGSLATVGFWAVWISTMAIGDDRPVTALVRVNDDMIAGLRTTRESSSPSVGQTELAMAG